MKTVFVHFSLKPDRSIFLSHELVTASGSSEVNFKARRDIEVFAIINQIISTIKIQSSRVEKPIPLPIHHQVRLCQKKLKFHGKFDKQSQSE